MREGSLHKAGVSVASVSIAEKYDPLAKIVVYQGDCLDLLAQVPDKSVRLVVTSPPYNIGKEYEDREPLDVYLEWQEAVIKECYRILADDGSLCWQVGNFVENGEIIPLDLVMYPIFQHLGMQMRNRIIWHFGHGLHAKKRFSGRYEVVLWFTKTDNYIFDLDPVRVPQKYPNKRYFKGPKKGQLSGNPLGKNPSDVWAIPNVKANHVEKTEHPCQFPVELIERLVLSMTNEGDTVFDPFAGVGSSAIAALMHKRKAMMAEIAPEYVSIMRERIAQAVEGTLRIRPMNRSVYDPNSPSESVPPKRVQLAQLSFSSDKAVDE